jgi:hypothetical protein
VSAPTTAASTLRVVSDPDPREATVTAPDSTAEPIATSEAAPHFREAERLLDQASTYAGMERHRLELIEKAKVHAQLAHVAATYGTALV